MALSSIDGLYSSSELAASSAAAAGGDSALGKDAFLKLLTTQLQYQDPLNPMDNSEFVAQLAQFSSLEQLQGLSDGMESLTLVNMSMNNASLTGLIGKNVVATGDTFNYAGSGDASIHYDSSAAATEATVTITNSDGTVVYSGDMGGLAEGEGSWTWNGKSTNGTTCPEGDYTFSITATDAAGDDVDVTEEVAGKIDGMDLSSGSPLLTIDGVTLELSSILRLDDGSGS